MSEVSHRIVELPRESVFVRLSDCGQGDRHRVSARELLLLGEVSDPFKTYSSRDDRENVEERLKRFRQVV